MRHDKFIKLAKKISNRSDHHSHKLACIIVRGSRIIGTGFNKLYKKSTKSPHAYFSIHSEFAAVVNAGWDVKGATAYVFRQHKDGTYANARPCPSCYKFLVEECGIKNIIYTFEGGFKEEKVG